MISVNRVAVGWGAMPVQEQQLPHTDGSFDLNAKGHLRFTDPPVFEIDGGFDDVVAKLLRDQCHFNLKHIAIRSNLIEGHA